MAHDHQLASDKHKVIVVMVPCLAQGHLNQLLHLSRLVSAHNLPVHYVCTETHNRQIRDRVHTFDPLTITNLHFHDLPTPSFQNLSPDPNSTEKFPSHLLPAVVASVQMREPVFNLLKELSATARRIVVVYDSLMAYVVQDIKSVENAESYCFRSTSVFTLFSFSWEDAGKPDLPDEACLLKDVPSLEGCFSLEFIEFAALQEEANTFQSGNIYNSNRVMEGLYLDLFEQMKFLAGDKHWAIGPFNPVNIPAKEVADSESRHNCLVWLDKQSPDSVMLVSFGTTTTLSNEQVIELAFGLERSGHKFIWLLKQADKGDIFTQEAGKVQLPEGFEERVKERGLVVRDWAPQLEILGHPSTGGFMSHCGWNSTMESISMGVPIATWPMHSDQPRNAVLITKGLRIGVEVLDDWERRDEVLSSSTIEAAVRRLMGSADGDEMRQRAKELAKEIKQSISEDGATSPEINLFIGHITR